MPDKFSKIYQNKIVVVGFFIKSQIPEVVKDTIRFQLLSNVLSYRDFTTKCSKDYGFRRQRK